MIVVQFWNILRFVVFEFNFCNKKKPLKPYKIQLRNSSRQYVHNLMGTILKISCRHGRLLTQVLVSGRGHYCLILYDRVYTVLKDGAVIIMKI